jgi:hypothetical protein
MRQAARLPMNERPIRLFLDTGVVIDGCVSDWAAAKVVLILATLRERYTVVLSRRVAEEIDRATARKRAALTADQAAAFLAGITGWLERVRLERLPEPSEALVRGAMYRILPALRHYNDLPAVVAAMDARPDWVISTNTAHWNDALAARTGLRIVTPLEFMRRLVPPPLPRQLP